MDKSQADDLIQFMDDTEFDDSVKLEYARNLAESTAHPHISTPQETETILRDLAAKAGINWDAARKPKSGPVLNATDVVHIIEKAAQDMVAGVKQTFDVNGKQSANVGVDSGNDLHASSQMVISDVSEEPENIFVRRGTAWQIRFQGREVFLRDRLGMTEIATLLARPYHEFNCTDFIKKMPEAAAGLMGNHEDQDNENSGQIAGGGAVDQLIDSQALKDTHNRLKEIALLLEDPNLSPKLNIELSEEREKLFEYVRTATTRGGTIRNHIVKNLRGPFNTVAMRITRAIKEIKPQDSHLSQHLKLLIKFSTGSVIYTPTPAVDWVTR